MKQIIIDGWNLFISPYQMLYDFLRDIYLEIKWFIQRGTRGYSDRDTWSIDFWLSNIMPKILNDLKCSKFGIPLSTFTDKARTDKTGNYTNQETIRAEIRWNTILNTIIKSFETSNKIINSELIYISSKNYNKNKYKKLKNVMTLKECKEFEKGFKLFQEYFFDLWS